MIEEKRKIFWLHIKKAGGTSMRDMFNDFYQLQEKRYTYPKPFIALPKEQWNDILNNYRVPLGEYDFKRMLFAKEFLYSDQEFESMYKFTVVRNPYDRAVSAWKYLGRNRFFDFKYYRMKRSFEYFLSCLPEYFDQRFKQIYHLGYVGLHIAPVWDDITDEKGNILIDKVVKLENFNEDISDLNKIIGKKIELDVRNNKGARDPNYRKYYNKKTIKLVEGIFYNDINEFNYNF